jgi:hypothetical protein
MNVFCRAAAIMTALATVSFHAPAQTLAPADAEAKPRTSLLNEIVMDYLRTDPEAPPGYNDILVKAESYINQRLSKANEPFRYDAKSGSSATENSRQTSGPCSRSRL